MVNIFRIFPQLITKHPHVFSPYLYISPPTRVFLILIYLAIPDTAVDYPPKIPINDHTLFFHHLRVPAPLKQTNKRTNKRKRKKKQARRREEKQWKKERAGGKSEQRASPSRGFIIPHIRRTVDLSLHLIPATVSLSLSPPLWNRYSLLFLPPGRVAPPPPPFFLSLFSFFFPLLSPLIPRFCSMNTRRKRGRTNGVVETELAWSTWEVRRSD